MKISQKGVNFIMNIKKVMTSTLSKKLGEKVHEWRKTGYKSDFPELSEILRFQKDEDGNFRYLRKAQFEAIEAYFYLRIIENTPHIFEFYKDNFKNSELREMFGISANDEILEIIEEGGKNALFDKIKTDKDFVKKYSLETVREMMMLEYPSYILALAMGAGKTTLIGAIIAIEFALAIETRNDLFLKNALVFAPGTTILRSLREIQSMPLENILPTRFYKNVLQNLKFVVASEAKELPIIEGNNFYVVITNTEKIRIQKRTLRTNKNQVSLFKEKKEEESREEANLRLQKIAQLDNLGVFSDEAHGLYGQKMNQDIKKVRQTVNFLADETNVKVVVNTTGTPYFQKQMLKEVIYWYGLSEGIKDNILKSVHDSIRGYPDVTDETFLNEILTDFFTEYGEHKTNKEIPAKIAIYFPRVEDLEDAKPMIETILQKIGQSPAIVTQCHSKAPQADQEAFASFHRPDSPHRVILLVGMGTEGWDCPPLFSCALAREISSSNNLVLQSSTRCLRQLPNNKKPARIYLSEKNLKILDRQFKETYGEALSEVVKIKPIKTKKIIVRKEEIPPISFEIERVFVRLKKDFDAKNIKINLKKIERKKEEFATIIADATTDSRGLGRIEIKETTKKEVEKMRYDTREVASRLARSYDLDFFDTLKQVQAIHDGLDFTDEEVGIISRQIEKSFGQRWKTETKKETITLALLKKEGFQYDEKENQYFAEIRYSNDDLILDHTNEKLGFHYTPYNFDSSDEREFFAWLLVQVGESIDNIEDIYFTGAITSPEKTDFWFWYKGVDNVWHRYTPDFLIRRKDGKIFIVEIKAEKEDGKVTDQKEMKMKKIENMNIDSLKFELIRGFQRLKNTEQTDLITKFIKS